MEKYYTLTALSIRSEMKIYNRKGEQLESLPSPLTRVLIRKLKEENIRCTISSTSILLANNKGVDLYTRIKSS